MRIFSAKTGLTPFPAGLPALILTLVVPNSSLAAEALPANLINYQLDEQLLSTIDQALPESSQVDASFLNPRYNPNLTFSENAQLAVTFVDEGAGYRNALGYFNFDAGAFDTLSFGEIDSDSNGRISVAELGLVEGVRTGLLFSNFSETGGGGQLNAGDTTLAGGGELSWADNRLNMAGGTLFEAGTTTGFFLMANAWSGSGVKGWDEAGETNVYYTLDFLNPENSASATLNTADPDSRHVAMMFASGSSEEIIVGFEDLLRPGGDNDFNDAVFIIHSDPFAAVSTNDLPLAAAPAPEFGARSYGLLLFGLLLPLFRQRHFRAYQFQRALLRTKLIRPA